LAQQFPDLDVLNCPIGVFGKEVAPDYAVQAGDRVEIYRDLLHDPREARRLLASRGNTMGKRSS
jgi:putative ubiquitin-RnfH superfamily antitoxin RatB of RatAB toxin-antitoxin module